MIILFVVDQLPFPPRNGVTIPVYNYISGLKGNFKIHLLYVTDGKSSVDNNQLEENKRLVDKLIIFEAEVKTSVRKIWDELCGDEFYFCPWDWVRSSSLLMAMLTGVFYDFVWFSPYSVGNVRKAFSESDQLIFVAGISDSATLVYRSKRKEVLKKGIGVRVRINNLFGWLRSFSMASTECKFLLRYQLVLVQTQVEVEFLSQISGNVIKDRLLLLSNGVNDTLFSLPLDTRSDKLLFLGVMTGAYRENMLWFLENVWPIIKQACPGIQFKIVGECSCPVLLRKMNNDADIQYRSYVADILSIFDGVAVMVSPVFKNYGLINKVVEAMAAGIVVVGDSGSFNGIPGFQPHVHGVVADRPQDMAEAVIHLLHSPLHRVEMSKRARELVRENFNWNGRIQTVRERLVQLKAASDDEPMDDETRKNG
jgi:glycosyltransferase involved in cell wall biosynthesis